MAPVRLQKRKVRQLKMSRIDGQEEEEEVATQASRSLHLMESGEYSDVTLIVGKEKVQIRAHKLLLIIASTYFEEQLLVQNVTTLNGNGHNGQTEVTDVTDACTTTEKAPETKKEETDIHDQAAGDISSKLEETPSSSIIIEDVEPEVFRLFLMFVYGGISLGSIKVKNALPLMVCGKKFKVPSLVSACERVLKMVITDDTAMTLFEQAVHYNSADLVESSLEFICKYAYKIVQRDDFAKLSVKALRLLIERDNLEVYDEMQLMEAVVAWAKEECIRREMDPKNPKYLRSVLEPVLKLIRFPQMSATDFTIKVARLKILTSDEVVDILQYYHVPPSHRVILPSEFFISTSRQYHKPTAAGHVVNRFDMRTGRNPGAPCNAVTQIRFKVNKCVWISSIGITPPSDVPDCYGRYTSAQNVKLKVKAEIRHSQFEDMCYGAAKKEICPSTGTTNSDHVEFKEPIRVNSNVWYTAFVSVKILQETYHTYAYDDLAEGTVTCETGVTFEFKDDKYDYSAEPKTGKQIPEIGYHLDD